MPKDVIRTERSVQRPDRHPKTRHPTEGTRWKEVVPQPDIHLAEHKQKEAEVKVQSVQGKSTLWLHAHQKRLSAKP